MIKRKKNDMGKVKDMGVIGKPPKVNTKRKNELAQKEVLQASRPSMCSQKKK